MVDMVAASICTGFPYSTARHARGQSTRLEIIVIPRAAEALGIAVPQSVLLWADKVIE